MLAPPPILNAKLKSLSVLFLLYNHSRYQLIAFLHSNHVRYVYVVELLMEKLSSCIFTAGRLALEIVKLLLPPLLNGVPVVVLKYLSVANNSQVVPVQFSRIRSVIHKQDTTYRDRIIFKFSIYFRLCINYVYFYFSWTIFI